MRLVALVAGVISLTLLAWSLWTPGRTIREQSLQPEQTGLPEALQLALDFPPAIQTGEADRVRLTVEAAEPTQAGVYATHNVLAEARLDIDGMAIRPVNIVSEPLLPGQGATFFWSIRPDKPGKSNGTVWFYLRFIPKDGEPERRQAVSAQSIEIESTTFVGIYPEAARWLGLVGTVIASLLGLPFLLRAFPKRGSNHTSHQV